MPIWPKYVGKKEDVLTKHIVYKHTKSEKLSRTRQKFSMLSQLPRKNIAADEAADIKMLEK